MKEKIILVVSIFAGIMAFVLSGQYLRHERERLMGDVRRVWVVAADKDLPAGSIVKLSDLGKRQVIHSAVGSRAVRPEDVREIVGKKLLFHIGRNDPIQWSDVDVPQRGELGLSDTVQPRLRAVSIAVDAVSAVSSMVRPNDHVDILGTFAFPAPADAGRMETVTLTVLQDVTVLAVGQYTARQMGLSRTTESGIPRAYGTLTLEVTPQEAELLVFAQSAKGRLSLTLRNPADVSFLTNLPSVNFEHIQSKLPELNVIRQRDIRHKKDLPAAP